MHSMLTAARTLLARPLPLRTAPLTAARTATIVAAVGLACATWTAGCTPTTPAGASEQPASSTNTRVTLPYPAALLRGLPVARIVGKAPPAAGQDPTAGAFDPGHVVDIAITMDPADFAELRAQRRTLVELEKPGCTDAPFASPFTKFPATATIDGQPMGIVHVKKRGFLGSVSSEKPALKISLGAMHYFGEDSLSLTNEIQDPSLVHTCMAYEIFTRAHVPAPRCNFAHVVVNGEDLGVYAHIEAPGRKMLARHFADATGNLYEGTYSDFAPGWDRTFSKDTNTSSPAEPEIARVEQAVAAGASSINNAVDVDEFDSFWSIEALIGDWDAYANGQNNFYIYGNPETNKVAFIPWGPDQTLVAETYTPFQSVLANGIVARTLYLDATAQAAYFARLQQLLDDVWDEQALDAEVDRMNALIAPYVPSSSQPYQTQAVAAVKAFIDGRRATIENELQSGPPSWNQAYPELQCLAQNGSVDATFQTTFGGSAGSASLHGTLDGAALPTTTSPAATTATAAFDANDHGAVALEIDLNAGGKSFVAQVSARARAFVPGTLTLDDEHAVFALYERVNGALQFRGRAFNGTLTLTSATTSSGAVVGSLHADLIDLEQDTESQ